ncbi:MAG: MBL fold metallo-hydrolase [Gemmatimonadota bacterium]
MMFRAVQIFALTRLKVMWFEQIVRRETGCATYVIGSSDSCECAVYDPLWDIEPYREAAAARASRIRYVIDSHSHADHVSGARRLAEATGAELVLPVLAEITYEATRVEGGDRIRMGEVEMEMVHTPGHRPEQLCLLITDHSRGEEPWCILTADFLHVGDLARPDLAQPGVEGAETFFDKAIPTLDSLPDFVEAYPGHVAGST